MNALMMIILKCLSVCSWLRDTLCHEQQYFSFLCKYLLLPHELVKCVKSLFGVNQTQQLVVLPFLDECVCL